VNAGPVLYLNKNEKRIWLNSFAFMGYIKPRKHYCRNLYHYKQSDQKFKNYPRIVEKFYHKTERMDEWMNGCSDTRMDTINSETIEQFNF